MIYLNEVFKNYEEFKELFGIVEHGNGVKSRRNKILLSYYKSDFVKKQIKSNRHHSEFLNIKSMDALKKELMEELEFISCRKNSKIYCHKMIINGATFYNPLYETDDFKGICRDGDCRSIRYINVEKDKAFKMKAGKMFNYLLSLTELNDLLNEQVKIWLAEDFASDWRAYAGEKTGDYTLHVGDKRSDFGRIYDSDSCEGDFGSCMVDKGYHDFYKDSVYAKAAWLENADGDIVARCIIYTEVHDCNTGEVLRLAERQYSSDGDDDLKRILVLKLIEGNHIDGYKRIGADCHDSQGFVKNDGTSFGDAEFSIHCELDLSDILSYQDSFKWYDINENTAYNFEECGYDYLLDITDGALEENHDGEVWSGYHEEWISEYDAEWVESREGYFYNREVCWCINTGTCEFEDDCVELENGDYAYYGRNREGYHDVLECPVCGQHILSDDSCYSEITEEGYCCSHCMKRAEDEHKARYWHYSEYDEEYFENVKEVLVWADNQFVKMTIGNETLDELIGNGEAIEFEGKIYVDDIFKNIEESIPVHFGCVMHI